MPDQSPAFSDDGSAGGHLVTPDGNMPLVSAALRVEASGGIARVVCEQRFVNRAREPLSTIYSLPLPADAAVAGFAFVIGDRRIVGEIDRKAAARARFEEAMVAGHTAALLEQERSSLFTQELANIPPGAEITAQVTLDQRLIWLDEGAWEWRFPTTVLPRYLGEPGRVPDAMRIAQAIADKGLAVRLRLALKLRDQLADGGTPHSPAHALRVGSNGGSTTVELAAEDGVPLDRDVVVRWPVARGAVAMAVETARPAESARHGDAAYGLVTIAPPARGAQLPGLPRDLIVLLDTSGSMDGRPLEQAQKVISIIVESLGDGDSLELIEFSAQPRRWKAEPVRASAKAKREALRWIESRRAGGGTEMREGILEALRPVRADSQRQVVVVTDGAIGFEAEAIAIVCERLPANCRLHMVGIGSAVNRSLTAAAARAGRGVEVVVGLDEDAERGAARLVRRTAEPLVVGLEIGGSALLASAPERLPDLFAGAPVLVGLKLRPEGGDLWVRGVRAGGGRWEETLRAPATRANEGNGSVVSLFARELVEDLELRMAADVKGKQAEALRAQIEQVGLDFAISTHFTSWVALTEETTVDPQAPSRRVRVPHELPDGTSVEGLGLRQPGFIGRTLGIERRRHAQLQGFSLARSIAASAPRAQRSDEELLGSFDAGRNVQDPEERADTLEVVNASLGLGALEDEAESRADRPAPLRGEVLLLKDGELVVGVTVRDGDFDWVHPVDIEIGWSGGTTIWATLVTERTTRAGMIAVGQTLRICLRLDVRPPGSPTSLRLRSPGRTTTVLLGRR